MRAATLGYNRGGGIRAAVRRRCTSARKEIPTTTNTFIELPSRSARLLQFDTLRSDHMHQFVPRFREGSGAVILKLRSESIDIYPTLAELYKGRFAIIRRQARA